MKKFFLNNGFNTTFIFTQNNLLFCRFQNILQVEKILLPFFQEDAGFWKSYNSKQT